MTRMRINDLDLHYVLCRPYEFVLMLTNTTDDGGKCYFIPKISRKKVPTEFILNTFVLIISLKFLKNSH